MAVNVKPLGDRVLIQSLGPGARKELADHMTPCI